MRSLMRDGVPHGPAVYRLWLNVDHLQAVLAEQRSDGAQREVEDMLVIDLVV